MAFSKIVGFDVTPRMPCSSTSRRRPPRANARVRLSFQGLWPNPTSREIGLDTVLLLVRLAEQRERVLGHVLRCEPELTEDDVAGRRRAEVVDRHHVVGIALPSEADALFDRERQ